MANKGTEIPIGDGSLHIGDRVVYPNQGICRITGVEVKQIAGRDWEVVTLSREEDGATVMVPRTKVMGIGLRKVASVGAIDDMFDQLAAPGDDPQLDWKVRHRENADRMTGGGLQGTLDVLKGLHALSRVRPLPQKERELYDSARHLLIGEIAAAMNLPLHVAEDNLDYALWPPPGMKRKGRPLQPAALAPPGSGGAVRPAPRAGDEEMDDEMDFADDAEVDAEPQAAKPPLAEEAEDLSAADLEEVAEPAGPAPRPAGGLDGVGVSKTLAAKALEAAAKVLATTRPPPPKPEPKVATAKAVPARKAAAKPSAKSKVKAKAKTAARKSPPARKPAPKKAAKKRAGKSRR
jgi:CarD family transcriptional regulator, regulator of rRNA transcription